MRIDKNLVKFIILSVFLVSFYFIYVQITQTQYEIIPYLKDLKVFAILLMGFLFSTASKGYSSDFHNSKYWKILLAVNFWKTTFLFGLMNWFSLHTYLTNDPYYSINVPRYIDFSTYYLVFYLIKKLVDGGRFKVTEAIYVILPMIYSGNRSIFLGVLLVFVLKMIISYKKNLVRVMIGSLILAIVLFLVKYSPEDSAINRFQILFSREMIVESLNHRFSPFYNKLSELETSADWIFGQGPGQTFFIPWFVYRDNIKNENICLDNLYLTLYPKYGLLSTVIIYFILIYFLTYIERRYALYLICYLLFIGLTNSFIHQNSFFLYLIAPPIITGQTTTNRHIKTI